MEPRPMDFQSGELTAAALGVVFLVVVVVAVIAGHSRLLQHRETLKMLELGGDAEKVLRLRERWRKRAGLLHGVKLIVVGVVFMIMSQVSSTWLAMMMPEGRGAREWLGAPPLFLLLGLLLSAVGAVYVVAYLIWSRSEDGSPEGTTREPRSFTALNRRRAMVRGVVLALVGGGVLAMAPAFSWVGWMVRGEHHFILEYVIGVVGVVLIAAGITVAVAYRTMPTTRMPGEGQTNGDLQEAQSEGDEQ